MPGPSPLPSDPAAPGLSDLTRTFLRIGLLSFGGPAAQIALMHRMVVDERRWIGERDYLAALSFCTLLPGPEAMQLATWIGWRLHGVRGGLIAGGLFVLPGALVVLALSALYAAFGTVPPVQAAFAGVQATVVVIVIEALLRVARRALKGRAQWWIAALAFAGLFALNLPFPVIVLAAGLWGFATARGGAAAGAPAEPAALRATLRTVAVWGALWSVPVAALVLAGAGVLADLALFFSGLALVTFGGAYAVLAWMAQTVVADYGWLTTQQMIDGLGLAETTPGPLILVVQFVGYLAAVQAGGPALGVAGAAVTLWVTFVPCFLWIFAGAPWLRRITAQPRLGGALSAITAAVVGVILNLSVWFAAHAFFGTVGTLQAGPVRLILPDPATFDLQAGIFALLAAWAILLRRWPLPAVIAAAALAGAGAGAF